MTLHEAAKALKVTYHYVLTLVRDGRLDATEMVMHTGLVGRPNKYDVSEEALEKYRSAYVPIQKPRKAIYLLSEENELYKVFIRDGELKLKKIDKIE